ncbi:MAG TPA: TSUP family transporter [Polyangiaceae bacterium]
MRPCALVALPLAGFAAGFVDAIAGGGGLVTVPALLAAGLPPQLAIATNKGQASFGALASFASFWVRRGIDRPRVPMAFACGLAGSFAGAEALLHMRPEPLRPIIVVLLLVAVAVVAWPRERALAAMQGEGPAPRTWAMAALGPVALVLGFYDGFFGPGVGSMLIVAFVLLFREPLARASGNAKVVNLASNLAALALFASRGVILWRVALPMAAANALGASVGAGLAVKHGERFVRPVLVLVVLAVVVKILVDIARS